jgi:hypothetical protein
MLNFDDLKRGMPVQWEWVSDLAKERGLRPYGRVVTREDLPYMACEIGIQCVDDPFWVIDPKQMLEKGQRLLPMEYIPARPKLPATLRPLFVAIFNAKTEAEARSLIPEDWTVWEDGPNGNGNYFVALLPGGLPSDNLLVRWHKEQGMSFGRGQSKHLALQSACRYVLLNCSFIETFSTAMLLSAVTEMAWESAIGTAFYQRLADLIVATGGPNIGCHPGLASWKQTAVDMVRKHVKPALFALFPWLSEAPKRVNDDFLARCVAEHGDTQTIIIPHPEGIHAVA